MTQRLGDLTRASGICFSSSVALKNINRWSNSAQYRQDCVDIISLCRLPDMRHLPTRIPGIKSRTPEQGVVRAMSDENQNKTAPALEPYVMRAIGRELRAMYAGVIAEGVPERFAEILRQLDEPTNEGSKNDATPPTI